MFRDRAEAGRLLADRLGGYAAVSPVVLGMARGGVIVAAEVARRLSAPLDVVVVRKIGHPLQPELAVGAVAEGDVYVTSTSGIEADMAAGLDMAAGTDMAAGLATARSELARRTVLYRSRHPMVALTGRSVIVVDDGIATGATARAACLSARARGADHVVLAVPVAPQGWVGEIGNVADECIALVTSPSMMSVGEFYDDFVQVDDADVIVALDESTR